jgi:carboxypeptidase family protein
MTRRVLFTGVVLSAALIGSGLLAPGALAAQGVTTAAMSGLVTDEGGSPLVDAIVVALHVPSGTRYRAISRIGGVYNIPNMRVGGPYQVTVTRIGSQPKTQEDVFLNLGTDLRLDFQLATAAVQVEGVQVVAGEEVERTGAATFVSADQVALLPSVKRSTRDLIRLDPRNDGNYSFGGRNWLYNNISLDGSYFNNPFGLDDPAPGGQTNAEPVPYDAVEQVQVSVAPFDVREGGFTGANVNTVTRSGTNEVRASAYTFLRNENLIGNDVRGSPVIANPDLSFLQSGFSLSGPLRRDRLFLFFNAEIERTDDPGTNFAASRSGSSGFGISRVDAAIMDSIRQRMIQEYNYDPGAYEGYVHETNNDKLIARLDWNLNENTNLMFRYNYLNAKRDLPPHPFVLSYNNTGRGPNESSLPFYGSGYAINNELHSFALEINRRSNAFANRLFVSYNRFRDFRQPFSEDFPTIEIGEAGLTYTTVGHEPFSIHNILDQDVWQFTNNLTLFRGRHAITAGANLELFSFFNSFNIFRHGLFMFNSTYATLADFFNATDPANPTQVDFRGMIGTGPYKGEVLDVGQLGIYLQDELLVSPRFRLTVGLRVDFPMYFTDPVPNPFSTDSVTALDENDQPEVVDQARLPGASPLFAPRVGFNWNASGDRRTQVRGGSGIFTGRVPFVWIGNVISNPGANPNLPPTAGADTIRTSDDAILQQSFDINAMDPNFKWPQVWTTDLAIDQELPGGFSGTLEFMYGKDLNAVYMRNADLRTPTRNLPAPDGRPFFGAPNYELNPDFGAGIYVMENTDEGWNLNITAQLRRAFGSWATSLSYSYTEARNNLKSTEIASVLWQNQPVQGDPNKPELSFSEFGQRHRIVGAATYSKVWSPSLRTRVGLFLEIGQGNRFAGAGGNRYSFIYSGDVNGDGQGGNDLMYIPRNQGEILFDTLFRSPTDTVTPAEQWTALDAFINQDAYLSTHRGQIAQRFGALNPWYQNMDLRILQDFAIGSGVRRHTFQLNIDILNVTNLLNSSWGVRKVATAAATSPLTLTRFDVSGAPVFNFTGPASTYIDDPTLLSRWRAQIGIRYFF